MGLHPKETGNENLLHGIIDIGHRTTDYVLFNGREFITDPDGLSDDSGIRVILARLFEYAQKHHGYRGQNIEKLRPVLHGEPFLCKGEFIDLSGPLEMLAKKHIGQIEQDVKKRWESHLDDMYKIILSGGGAYLFKNSSDFLKANLKQIVIPREPEFSNAIGFFRFAKMAERLKLLKVGKNKA